MLPTLYRDAVVDEHISVSSTAGDSLLLPSNADANDRTNVDSLDESSVGRASSVGRLVRSGFAAVLTPIIGLVSNIFTRSPSVRTCGKRFSVLWKNKMLFLSNWMSHLVTNWKATLRYVLGKLE